MTPGISTQRTSAFRTIATSPYLLLTCAALFWAGNVVIGRALGGQVPAVALNFWRWALALPILIGLSFGELHQQRTLLHAEWKLVLGLGLTGVAAYNAFAYQALSTTTAINAVLFTSTAPILIVLLSWIVFRDTVTMRQATGIAVSMLGVVVVVARGDPATLLGLRFNPGDLWMLAAIPIWAIYSVLLKRRPASLSPLALLTASVVVGVALLLPINLWLTWQGAGLSFTLPRVLGLAYIAIFSSVIAFLCWNKGVALIGPNRAGTFIHLLPVFGTLLSIIFLGERPAIFHGIGAALVFTGIVLTSKSRRSSSPVPITLVSNRTRMG